MFTPLAWKTRQAMCISRDTEACCRNTAAVEKQYYISPWECARAWVRAHVCVRASVVCVWVGAGSRARICACVRVALLIQHDTRRRHVVCGLWLHHVCRRYLIKGTIFQKKKKSYWTEIVFVSSTTFIWNISYSKNNSARFCHKYESVFMQSTSYFCRF